MLLVILRVGEAGTAFAVVVEGKKGSENGCDLPGVEEEVAAGGAVSVFVVGLGGTAGAALGVAGIVATVRIVDFDEKRARSVRRQLLQSIFGRAPVDDCERTQ